MSLIHSAKNMWDNVAHSHRASIVTWCDASDYHILRQDLQEPGSLLMLINQADHAPRRVIWDRAFSTTSLKTHLPMMHSQVHELTSQLTAVFRGG
jgi:cytochrome P450